MIGGEVVVTEVGLILTPRWSFFCVQLGLLDSMRGPPNLNLINQRILSRRRSTIRGHAFPVAGAYM